MANHNIGTLLKMMQQCYTHKNNFLSTVVDLFSMIFVGWIIEIEISNEKEYNDLMTEDDYEKFIEEN